MMPAVPPQPDSLRFFTVADRRYEPFVLPYLASALHHNPTASVEICMERPGEFTAENRQALALLDRRFAGRVHLTQFVPKPGVSANAVRFLTTPKGRTDLVYIGDVDVLILEEVAPAHLDHMKRTGLPYSNIRRPNEPRLSGLHFTRWEAYYPVVKVSDRKLLRRDESMLYWLVDHKGLGLPEPDDTFRPSHGYHLSISRDTAGTRIPWGGLGYPVYLARYVEFASTSLWRELAPLLDARYRQLLSMLDIALAQRFPAETQERQAAPGTLPKDWWSEPHRVCECTSRHE